MFLFFAACERIDKCDPRWIVKNLNVTFHDRGSDFGWYAKVSWRPFKGKGEDN